jgi:hypothetical protein
LAGFWCGARFIIRKNRCDMMKSELLKIKTLAPACFERSPMPAPFCSNINNQTGVASWIFHPPTHFATATIAIVIDAIASNLSLVDPDTAWKMSTVEPSLLVDVPRTNGTI